MWGQCKYRNKCFKSNINLLTIPSGGRLTTWLITSVSKELKLSITMLILHLVVSERKEHGTLNLKSGT